MILLKELRLGKGLTLKQVGKAVGRSEAAICRYEKGNRMPNIDTAYQLAEAVGYEGSDIRKLFEEKED